MDEARFVADTYKILDILSAMTNKIRMLQMINCQTEQYEKQQDSVIAEKDKLRNLYGEVCFVQLEVERSLTPQEKIDQANSLPPRVS